MAAEDELGMPPLMVAVVDAAAVEALLLDIEHGTELYAVMVKGHARANASTAATSIEEARRQLLDSEAPGVQLRYRHRGVEWWDTILRVAEGFRVVRIEQRLAPRQAELGEQPP